MHRTPLIAGAVSMLVSLLLVLTLAAGFSVDMTQAISQSAPILLAIGGSVTLGAIVLNREIA